MEFNTKLLHGRAAGNYADGSTLPTISQANAYEYEDFETLERVFAHKAMGYAYSRIGNPTVTAFEVRINETEGGIGAVATSSGMAAITETLLTFLSPGDELIAAGSLYGGTLDLLGDLQKFGITTRYVNHLCPEEIEPLLNDKTRCIFGEVISNPALRVVDIPTVADLAHKVNIPFVLDNTTATPYLVNPLSLGADIVIHSASKYISGSGNAISGIIVDGGSFVWDSERFPALAGFEKFGKFAFLSRLRTDLHENFGGCLSPQNAFYNVLGLETLGLRMDRICRNAAELAKALQEAGVKDVNHPSLPGHEAYDLCKRQFRDGLAGGILTFRAGSKEKAVDILNGLQNACIASNIGDVRTLVIYPATTIFLKSTEAQRNAAGVFDDTIRVSVGIEDIEDLKKDFLSVI